MATIPKFILDPKVQHAELKLAESSSTGLLPNDPFWRYVEGRFNLALEGGHLARFEHYHPVITPLLEKNMEELQAITTPAPSGPISMLPVPPTPPSAPVQLPVVTCPPVVASGPPVTVPVPPMTLVPPSVSVAVPEPSSVILASLGLFAALLVSWWRS